MPGDHIPGAALLSAQIFFSCIKIFFTHQVLDALVYIHRLRVVHMDIKPNNILLASKDKNNLKVK